MAIDGGAQRNPVVLERFYAVIRICRQYAPALRPPPVRPPSAKTNAKRFWTRTRPDQERFRHWTASRSSFTGHHLEDSICSGRRSYHRRHAVQHDGRQLLYRGPAAVLNQSRRWWHSRTVRASLPGTTCRGFSGLHGFWNRTSPEIETLPADLRSVFPPLTLARERMNPPERTAEAPIVRPSQERNLPRHHE